MPSKEEYARLKALGGKEYMKRESQRQCKWAKDNRDKFNARRRNNYRAQINRIQKQARDRNYPYLLTDDEERALLYGDCVYCGAEAGPFNTIDRLDNARGYVTGNVVTACDTCNMTKGCLDPQTYIDRCKHIAFIHTGEGELHEETWAPTKHASVTMAIYKRSAKKKGLAFELTEEEFDELTNDCCTYCCQPTTAIHKNGIDRVESGLGYVADNCVTCCGQCNIAKKKLTNDEFIEHVCKVAGTTHPDFSDIPRCMHIITRRSTTTEQTKTCRAASI